jgi:hypothetical protein
MIPGERTFLARTIKSEGAIGNVERSKSFASSKNVPVTPERAVARKLSQWGEKAAAAVSMVSGKNLGIIIIPNELLKVSCSLRTLQYSSVVTTDEITDGDNLMYGSARMTYA